MRAILLISSSSHSDPGGDVKRLNEIPKTMRLLRRRMMHGMMDHLSRNTNMRLIPLIRNKALDKKHGRNLRRRSKLILKLFHVDHDYIDEALTLT